MPKPGKPCRPIRPGPTSPEGAAPWGDPPAPRAPGFGPGAGSPLEVAAGLVWLDGDRVLVQRRGPGAGFGAGAWELPGGKVEPGEAPSEALARELVEEWGPAAAELAVGNLAEVIEHAYPPPGPRVRIHVFHVLPPGGLGDPSWARGAFRARLRPAPEHEPAERLVASLEPAAFLDADRDLLARVCAGRLRPPSR